MKLPTVLQLVSGDNRTYFRHYQDYKLWYAIQYNHSAYDFDEFTYPVAVSDTGNGIFLPEDKALVHMRWIRKHLEFLAKAQENA